MDYLRGLAIIWVLCVLTLPGLAIGAICEGIDKRRYKKDKYLIEQRRREFAEDCERAGRKMLNADRVQQILHSNVKRQTIKYTGLFSGEEVERKLNNEV